MKMSIQYKNLKLVDLLSGGEIESVLFKFYHGLGDAVDFYCNVLPVLKFKFPHVEFYMDTHAGQEMLFGEVDQDESNYDLCVFVNFPCAEWEPDDETKAEKCLRVEMGVPAKQQDIYVLPRRFGSPFVGVHFFSTSSEFVTWDESDAEFLWDHIASRGLIPIDTHFAHPSAKIAHHPFGFVDRSVCDDKIQPNVGLVCGTIRACSGFAGVSGGNFWIALATLPPECILYIETEFPASKLTHLPVWSMKGYDEDVVDSWLDCVYRYFDRDGGAR